jgi:endonuclease YncB( thermonuclease family)
MSRLSLAILAALALVTSPVSAQRVDRVIDGDTVAIAGVGSVRLIGVDSPETVDPRQPVQDFGREAAAFLRGLIGGKVVRLEFEQQRRDKYQRTLAYLYLADGTFVNAEIVKQGYGHAYTQYPFRHMEQFRALERAARTDRRGLWASEVPVDLAAIPQTADQDVAVYVTRSGTKYHRAGCRSLARSQIPIALADAMARYGACGICKPPTAIANTPAVAPVVTTPRPTKPSAPATSSRCQAITKRGTQCSRNAQAGRSYCWQH